VYYERVHRIRAKGSSGTIAAGIQASIGNVAADSLFAFLQSAAMGGGGIVFVGGVMAGITAGITALGCWGWQAWESWWSKGKDTDQEQNAKMIKQD
jgi:hypothetical protein